MSPKRLKWLVRISVLMMVVGLALIVLGQALASPSPPRGGEQPARAARASFVVYAYANNTTQNGTANTTAGACTPQANDYCYRQLVQVWSYISQQRDQLWFLQIALSIAVAVILILIAAVAMYAHNGVKAAKEMRLSPDDPEAIAETGALMEYVAPEEMKLAVRQRSQRLIAKKSLQMRERKRAQLKEEA